MEATLTDRNSPADLLSELRRHEPRLSFPTAIKEIETAHPADLPRAMTYARKMLGMDCAVCGEPLTDEPTHADNYCSRECWAQDGGDL